MYRIKTVFTGLPGLPGVNHLYFSETGGTAAQAATAAGVFWGAMDDIFSASFQAAFDGNVEIVNIATGDITDVESATPYTVTGLGSDENLPFAVQGLLRWRTGVYVNGRESRGRTFLPCVPEAMNSDGVPSSAYKDTVNNAAAALLADANSTLVIYSRENTVENAVATGTCWTNWASLRSRRD